MGRRWAPVLAITAGGASLALLTACSGSAPTPVVSSSVAHAPTMVPATSQERGGSSSALPPTVAPTSPAELQAAASAQVASVASGLPAGSVSVAALNTATGASFSAGATSGMWTASAYKLFVLETLLLRRQSSGGLSSSQLAAATRMIENSDNVAGYSLFEAAGGNSALAAAAKQFGMTNTVPGRTDPTFTTTSASDYLHLLQNLVSPGPLNASSQALALGLMTHVEADQRWGVGVVADPGTTFANKNGWLSVDNTNGAGEEDNGLWVVSSVGVLTVHGQQVLMSIFTRHRPSMQNGVKLVQTLAQDIAPAVAP